MVHRTTNPTSLHDHRQRVQRQRQIHRARMMLIEAADRLLELDAATLRDSAEAAETILAQAHALASAAKRDLNGLSVEIAAQQSERQFASVR